MEKITIAVLMTCFNRKSKTILSLHALFDCTIPQGIEFTVFLVDDASNDGTSLAVATQFPSVHIIQGSGKLFWNRGMYLAWKTALQQADYNYFLWLNDDTFLFRNALSELLEIATIMGNDGIISGILQSEENDLITYGGINKKGEIIIPNGTIQTCFEINGNCVLIPRKIVKQIGIIDPIYPHAFGDFDYAHRVRVEGYSCLLSREVIGICEKNITLPIWCNTEYPFPKRLKNLYTPKAYCHPFYQFIFEKKHYGILKASFHVVSIHIRALFPSLWKKTF